MTAQQRTTKQVVDDTRAHLSELVDAHKELAKAEVKQEVADQVKAIVPMAAAGFVGLYVLTFLLVAGAKGLEAAGLAEWAAWLVVAGVLLLIALVALLIGRSRAKKNAAKDPAPARIQGEVKSTTEWAKARVTQTDQR